MRFPDAMKPTSIMVALLFAVAFALPVAAQSDEEAKRYHMLPHIADGEGWQSTLLVTNVSRSASVCTIELHGLTVGRFEDTGGVMGSASSATFELPGPAGNLVWRTRNRSALASGYATLDCTAAVTAQVVFAWVADGERPTGMATVFSSQAANFFQFPVLTAAGTVGFAVANDTNVDATCRILLQDSGRSREELGLADISVPSKTNVASLLLRDVIAIPAGFQGGSATVSCDQPVAMIALHFELEPNGTVITFNTLPPALVHQRTPPFDAAKPSHLLPHIADGGGWQSILLVTNVTPSPSQCTLELQGLTVDRFVFHPGIDTTSGRAVFNLPARDGYLLWPTRNDPALASGYARLDCTAAVAAQVVFAWTRGAARPTGMATVFSAQAGLDFQFPVLTPAGTLGFAIANDTNNDAACRIDLVDSQQMKLGSATISVPSKSNVASLLLSDVIAIPGGFRGGTASVSCDQPVAMIGLHFELELGGGIITFNTLPPAILAAPDLTGMASDRVVLEALYHATSGPAWNDRTNWLSAEPLGDWFGVETDRSGRVTSLLLPGNGLSGLIPSDLAQLDYLERLDLWRNQLRGSIPSELGGMTKLQTLNLGRNQLSGAIPVRLGNLANLQTLWLPLNQLRGTIPTQMGNLSNLHRLNLTGNQLSGPIPTRRGNLADLQTLWLGENQLRGSIPPELGGMTKLQRLSLERNQLGGAIPAELINLTNLNSLYFGGNYGLCAPGTSAFVAWHDAIENTDDKILFCNKSDVAVLEALHKLTGGENWTRSDGWLDGTLDTWHGVRTDPLGRVTTLDLSGNGLSGKLPAGLGNLPQLTELRLGRNPGLSGALPLGLASLALRTLHYDRTSLCAPGNATFSRWLNGIRDHRGNSVDCRPQIGPAELTRFLQDNPRIAAAMVWLGTDNHLKPYAEWPQTLKEKLVLAVGRLSFGGSWLPEVMTNQANTNWQTVLSKEDAEDLYVDNVAYSLILEMLGTIPWSLDDLSEAELTLLLGSQSFYSGYRSHGGVTGYAVHGSAMPAPPVVIGDFMAVEGLVGESRYETLINMIDWARYHLYHYGYPADRENYEADVDHWDYRGTPPLARILGVCAAETVQGEW